jgi:hypothetical protein
MDGRKVHRPPAHLQQIEENLATRLSPPERLIAPATNQDLADKIGGSWVHVDGGMHWAYSEAPQHVDRLRDTVRRLEGGDFALIERHRRSPLREIEPDVWIDPDPVPEVYLRHVKGGSTPCLRSDLFARATIARSEGVQELLAQDGVRCSYMTLLRFVRRSGWSSTPRSTVRVAESQPGEVAEIDYGRMGMLLNPLTGKRQAIWALVIVLPFSRHCFVWLTTRQTLEATIEGLEAAWRFFGGVPHRVVLDNFPAAIAGPDALEPRPTRGFFEYSQARGFLLDPARVRHPKDKPHVERTVRYVRERFWKGGRFNDLIDARRQAQAWCLEVAGRRIHGSTGHVPLVVFGERERAHLLPIGDEQ